MLAFAALRRTALSALRPSATSSSTLLAPRLSLRPPLPSPCPLILSRSMMSRKKKKARKNKKAHLRRQKEESWQAAIRKAERTLYPPPPKEPEDETKPPPPREFGNETLDLLERRGLLQQVSSKHLAAHLNETPRTIYLGVDPTANTLHVGHLLPLLSLFWLVMHGHRGILLIGGATGSIGDPSGKTAERQSLSPDVLNANAASIVQQLRDLIANVQEYLLLKSHRSSLPENLNTDILTNIEIFNNVECYQDMNVLSFLKDVGKLVRIGDVLARDSVKNRLAPPHGIATDPKAGMSFTEFSYQLLQAHDFHWLNKHRKCTVQIGGSDQMGNIVAGVDLIRRKRIGADVAQKHDERDAKKAKRGEDVVDVRVPEAFGITVPLLTNAKGEKIGKSERNSMGLSPRTSGDLELYQYFLRLPDDDVDKFLSVMTFLDQEQVQGQLEHYKPDDPRAKQKILAEEMLTMLRGRHAIRRAQAVTSILYGLLHSITTKKEFQRMGRERGDEIWDALSAASSDIDSKAGDTNHSWQVKKIKRKDVWPDNRTLIDLLMQWNVAPTKSKLRDAYKSGMYINGLKLTTPEQSFAKIKLKETDLIKIDPTPTGRAFIAFAKSKRDIRVILVEPDDAESESES